MGWYDMAWHPMVRYGNVYYGMAGWSSSLRVSDLSTSLTGNVGAADSSSTTHTHSHTHTQHHQTHAYTARQASPFTYTHARAHTHMQHWYTHAQHPTLTPKHTHAHTHTSSPMRKRARVFGASAAPHLHHATQKRVVSTLHERHQMF